MLEISCKRSGVGLSGLLYKIFEYADLSIVERWPAVVGRKAIGGDKGGVRGEEKQDHVTHAYHVIKYVMHVSKYKSPVFFSLTTTWRQGVSEHDWSEKTSQIVRRTI